MEKSVLFYLSVFFGISFFLGSQIQPMYAAEFKTGDDILITADSTLNGSLYTAGQSVRIDAAVPGDLLCAGQEIIITQDVDGDVICAGQNIEISGNVSGDVRVVAQTIRINSNIDGNVMAFGQTLTQAAESVIDGEVVFAGQTAQFNGVVNKTINGVGQRVEIDGNVGGNIALEVESLRLGQDASVSGSIWYTSDKEAIQAKGSTISGLLQQTMPLEKKTVDFEGPRRRTIPNNPIGSLIFFLIVGILANYFFPNRTQEIVARVESEPGKSIGVGFLTLIGTPILGIALVFTIIGIPVTLALFLVFVLSIVLSRVFVAISMGRKLVARFLPDKKGLQLWETGIGIVVSWLVFAIPFIGGLASFIAMLWGLGGLVLVLWPKAHVKAVAKKPAVH